MTMTSITIHHYTNKTGNIDRELIIIKNRYYMGRRTFDVVFSFH